MAAVLHTFGDFKAFALDARIFDSEGSMPPTRPPICESDQAPPVFGHVAYNPVEQQQYFGQAIASSYDKTMPLPSSYNLKTVVSPLSGSMPQSYSRAPSMISSTSGNSAPDSSKDDSPNLPVLDVSPHTLRWADSLDQLVMEQAQMHHEARIHDDLPLGGMTGELAFNEAKFQGFVDPSMLQHFDDQSVRFNAQTCHTSASQGFEARTMSQRLSPISPVTSESAIRSIDYEVASRGHDTESPTLLFNPFQAKVQGQEARRLSVTSSNSRISTGSLSPSNLDDDSREKSRCHDCGRLFKDLKAHMLTHQSERPEKCPILTCSYHLKGFARKYDKNRHTLTHYKGTMVCGFCPGSGSSTEKSFNRADVFKRHLTSLHGVEQTPPNSRRKSPNPASTKRSTSQAGDITGKCSTCSATFDNAQDFYEHLDDCVLRVVQQEEPSEAINEMILRAVNLDKDVKDTLDRHMLPSEIDLIQEDSNTSDADGDDDEVDDEDTFDDIVDGDNRKEVPRNSRSGKGSLTLKQRDSGQQTIHCQGALARKGAGKSVFKNERLTTSNRKGLTVSKGGVPLIGKGRRRRKHYPASWGCSAEQMRMKKRVLCVYDGSRRLWKDDMMLGNEFEVRMRINKGKSYVTDLDVETVKRAEGFHEATNEEKGPWILPDPCGDEVDIEKLMS